MLSFWYVHFANTFAKNWIVIHDGFEARQNDIIRRRARMNIQMLQRSCCRNAKTDLEGTHHDTSTNENDELNNKKMVQSQLAFA